MKFAELLKDLFEFSSNTETFTSNQETYPNISQQKIEDFAKIDLHLLQSLLQYDNLFDLPEKRNLLRNLLVQATDDSKYEDDYIHIYIVPYLGNHNITVIEGINNKPLILLSLYRKENNNIKKNILSLDTTKLEPKWLIKYMNNTQQYAKHSRALDELINGNSDERMRLENIYDNLKNQLTAIGLKYPGLKKTIKDYNCAQQKIIKLYSIDYLKHDKIIELKKFRKQSNYTAIVEDKINQLQEQDTIKIRRLTQESNRHKQIIDNHNSEFQPIMKKLKETELALIDLYSQKVNAQQIKDYRKKVNLFKKEIQKVSYSIDRIYSATIISQVMASLCGLSINNFSQITDKDYIKNNIKDGGIIFNNNDLNILKNNINKSSFSNMPTNVGQHNLFIPKVNIAITSNNKCSILNNSGTIKIANKTFNNVKSLCEESVIYNNGVIPFLSLQERLAMIQNLISNRHNYEYLDDNDIIFLEKVKVELQNQLNSSSTTPVVSTTNNMSNIATINYIRNTIYSKSEALDILNNIINNTQQKLERTLPASDILIRKRNQLASSTNNNYIDSDLQGILPIPRHTRQIINERIQCPTNVFESPPINNSKTLDDYLNNGVCQNYIDSFEESYI